MSSGVVAIHQPNFYPWLGYFDKIRRADVFIFMDNVQLPRTSRGTWVNRVKLLVGGAPRWLTCPVRKASGLQSIKDIDISENVNWRGKHWATIAHNYRRCPGWSENAHWLRELLEYAESSLAQYNIYAIRAICAHLDLRAEFVLGSELGEFEETATDLLIAMTKCVGGDTYLTGGGANGYQIGERFAECGVALLYQNFQHPVYQQQANVFVPGLSTIDALLNCGVEVVARLLETASG